jgi:elongation factor 2
LSDQFFDPTTKKWAAEKTNDEAKRGFVLYVLEPIYKIFNTCMTKAHDEALALIEKMGVKLSTEERDLQAKDLLKVGFFTSSIYGYS